MLDTEIRAVVGELIPLLTQLCLEEYGIAVGGAHAKGTDDSESDLDLYVFTANAHRNTERSRLASQFSPDITELISWGPDDPFVQGGTDFYYKGHKVECWLRNRQIIDRAIADGREGILTRELVTWTITGFYNHCALSDIKVMLPVVDPAGIIASWQSEIAVYPPKLQNTIINNHLSAARFWPHNFHYSSAVERQDVIYTSGIVQQVVHNLIQVMFAINQTYFPGDKKLAKAIGHLARTPASCVDRIHWLLLPQETVNVALLRRQQVELQQLLKDVEALVAELQ
ncbi:MAG: DUF4037 domain-containing protein [Anaerolineae bacterium]